MAVGRPMAEVSKPMIAAAERGPGPKYAPSLGAVKHKAPAFSLGKRATKDISKIDDSPGPKYSINETMTTKGAIKNPSFSLSSRHKDPIPYNTPGPGSYQVEKCAVPNERRSAAYVMGMRTRYRKSDSTPGPSQYSLPTTLGHKLITSNTKASRAFAFNSKPKKGSYCEDLAQTPGPSAYALHNDNKTRRKAPSCSMSTRTYIPGDPTQKPGPGAHCPEKVILHKPRSTGVVFGNKHSEFVTELIVDVD